MPYITQEERKQLEHPLDELIGAIHLSEKPYGLTNYLITRLVCALKPESGWNYQALNNAQGVFTCAGEEFYRRLIGPYEQKAILAQGDIPEYESPF